jgi:hypothetical protein
MYGQQDAIKCNCPPVKVYIYDTKIDFKLDSNVTVEEAGKFTEAQNSGDWLEGQYTKQQSDELKVYKSLRPGAEQGKTVEFPPPDGGSSEGGIDFSSYADVSRTGSSGVYTYIVTLKIFDTYTHNLVTTVTQNTTDPGKVDDLIDASVNSFSPVINKLRDYQKDIRDKSGNTKWIGLKWHVKANKTKLDVDENTNVQIIVVDCLDKKPAPNQQLHLIVSSPQVGILNTSNPKK